MIKCPFCQFENEDGVLFCEQCKSDLAGVESVPLETPPDTSSEASPLSAVASAEPILPETIPLQPIDNEGTTQEIPKNQPEREEEWGGREPGTDLPAAATVSEAGIPTMTPPLPPGTQPKLMVLRGLKINTEYPIYEGLNFVGRTDEKPVDIDLEDQEPPDRIWSSRQHACITLENGLLQIEDLNSSNGTFVNRTRVYPGQKRQLNVGDVIQIGTVQMKVKI